MNERLKGAGFSVMTKDEKIKALVDAYAEDGNAEIAAVAEKLRVPAKFMREMDMPEAKIWAALVLSNAEALELDLDDPNGMAAVAILSYYQMQAS